MKHYSRIVAPLTKLSRKDVPFIWTTECQAAVDTIKTTFSTVPILWHFDQDRKIILKTNTSDYVSAGILLQYDDNGILHPVAFFSKQYTQAKCNYEIYDKELMAIVRCFEEW